MSDFDFLYDNDEDEVEEAPEETITLVSSTGGRFFLPTNGEMTIAQLVEASGLTLGNSIQYFVEGNQVDPETVIAPNTTVTALGNIKGG